MNKPSLEEVWELITQLEPEDQEIIRRRMNGLFRDAVNVIRADIPFGVTEAEIQADIERAIREVRGLPEE